MCPWIFAQNTNILDEKFSFCHHCFSGINYFQNYFVLSLISELTISKYADISIFTADVLCNKKHQHQIWGLSRDKVKARWCLRYTLTRGFILKTIQWHMHTGSWSLVNCWREGSYEALYKVLMNINESGCQPYGWPRPWWWSVYPRDTPTSPFLHERRGFACMQRNYC